MGWDDDFGTAFLKSQMGCGVILPTEGAVFISVRIRTRPALSKQPATLLSLASPLSPRQVPRLTWKQKACPSGPSTRSMKASPTLWMP
jgi:carbamoyl-phosphate synthase large subunit